MKKTLFVVFLALSSTLLTAQSAAEKKMDALISALMETKFIVAYKEYKNETEAKISELKIETTLDAKEVAKVKIAYNQSKFKFDAILDQLKRDLANSATRKLILKSPNTFSNTYQRKLDEAKESCNNSFHKKADLLLKKDALDTQTLELLMGTFFTIFKSMSEQKKASNEFSAAYLETELIDPLRFKAWDKIE